MDPWSPYTGRQEWQRECHGPPVKSVGAWRRRPAGCTAETGSITTCKRRAVKFSSARDSLLIRAKAARERRLKWASSVTRVICTNRDLISLLNS